MAAGHPLLEFIGTRYAQSQESDDELRVRAVELIAAACVREWVDLPAAARAFRVQPAPVEGVPSLDHDELVPDADEGEPDEIPEFPEFERDEPEPAPVPEPEPETTRQPEPERASEDTESASWWGASPAPGSTDPVRGAWEPPKRS